jgi:hypothetical protein
MQQFYDDVKKPTDRNLRIQNAADCLGYLLTFLGKEVPETVKAAFADEFSSDTAIEKTLYKELVDLIDSDPKRASEVLDAATVASASLKLWWVGYHDARREYSVEAIRLANKLKDADGNVAIYHEAGVCTHWLTRGTQSWPDPDSRTNDLSIPLGKLTARTGDDAGGAFTYLTYPSNANFHNIVRAIDGRLVAGSTKRPNWML